LSKAPSNNAPVIVATIRGVLSYQQSAEIMHNIGCKGAIMLDGGSSTSMYEQNNGIVVNSSFFRGIANAIIITSK